MDLQPLPKNVKGEEGPKRSRRKKISRIKSLEMKLEAERKRTEEYINRLLYLQADFENYRKRVKREIEESIKYGNEKLIKKLLNVIDELELAVKSGRETKNKDALIKGVEIVLKKMYSTLESEGLSKIEAIGKPFDPKLHEAVVKVNTEEYPDGTVIEEVRKGFILNGKVIRPSMVKIASTPKASNGSKSSCKVG